MPKKLMLVRFLFSMEFNDEIIKEFSLLRDNLKKCLKNLDSIIGDKKCVVRKSINQYSEPTTLNLINSDQKHIQIIGLFARAKKIECWETNEAMESFIKRNLRASSALKGYNLDRIIEVMGYLVKNANYKWTLESVGKYTEENLAELSKKENLNKNEGRLHDGTQVVKKFGKWVIKGNEGISLDPHYYPEIAKEEILSEDEWITKKNG